MGQTKQTLVSVGQAEQNQNLGQTEQNQDQPWVGTNRPKTNREQERTDPGLVPDRTDPRPILGHYEQTLGQTEQTLVTLGPTVFNI